MKDISIDLKMSGLSIEDFQVVSDKIERAHKTLQNKSGLGNDYIGWLDYPDNYDKDEFEKIKQCAKRIQKNSDVLLVIGIGGSYLGAKAALSALTHTYYNELPKSKRKTPAIYFIGNDLSGTHLSHLLEIIEDKDISINVISKSGTTTEPAIAFRVLKNYLEEKYKEKAKDRIYVTTDKKRGALKTLAEKEGYETFVIPDDVGGRYSIFTPVGLLPIATAGISIDEMMKGAIDGRTQYDNRNLKHNPCYQYAVARNILLKEGKTVELLVNYEPNLSYISEWWKQLYGESEGKDGKGIYPSSAQFTTDLHSMGQYVQGGQRMLFETVLNIQKTENDIEIKEDKLNLDNLNYLKGKKMDWVNKRAFEGTLLAHVDGYVPNIIINIPELTPYFFGKLIYLFMKACGLSGYILDVNPFDQPGVEEYKKNMFALLGKPGYEELKEKLDNRIKE